MKRRTRLRTVVAIARGMMEYENRILASLIISESARDGLALAIDATSLVNDLQICRKALLIV